MNTLTRYVLRELLWPLLATIALLIVVGSTAQLVKMANEISGVGLSLGELVGALPFALPTFFARGLPIAFLLAMLVAFGRMAEERELLALAASGISMRRLLTVPLIMGTFLTAFGFLMTIWAEPRALEHLRNRLVESAADYFSRTLEPGVIHDQLSGFMLYFGARDEDGEVHDVVIADERDPTHARLLTASFGRIELAGGSRLSFLLKSGELQEGAAQDPTFRRITFDELDWRLDIGFFVWRAVSQIPMVNALPLSELYRRTQEGEQADRDWYTTWLHRKFTYPLANLIFVLLVFPVTTVLSRQSRLLAYVAAAGMVAVYFTMAEATATLIRLGFSAAAATWFPNLLFLAIGAALTIIRVRR